MPNVSTIDERVVEMRIDNRQFVKGADKSISILNKLKNALDFKKAAQGFNEIERSANRVDLGSISKNVDKLTDRFSTLGLVWQKTISRLTDSAITFGKNFVNSLTIDQITGGWAKYEDITSSIHTIMGATANSWEQTFDRLNQDYGFLGTQMDYVSMQMEKLNWFTDETSAALTDMVNNIGKFTNSGVELDDAVTAMMGISTWGYKSGATVNEISRAMYNLSQAMALGEVRLMDWRSIENANMATIEFKQTVIDTAVALGTLKEVGEGVYQTVAKGTEVTATNFSDALSEGWFSSDVLQASLYQYGHFADTLQQVVDRTGLSTRTLLDYVEQYKNGVWDAEVAQNELFGQMAAQDVPSIDALEYALYLLTDQEDELGYQAFRASQETKTLAEAIAYTKDAVSSGWMKTWEYIFGDYEEAKAFWGDLTDVLYELFVQSGETRNAILNVWHDEGGRDAFIEGIWNIYDTVMAIIQPIHDAFDAVFGWGSIEEAGNKLIDLTYNFRDFTRSISLSEETLAGMRHVFESLFKGAKSALKLVGKVFSAVSPIFTFLKNTVTIFFNAFSEGSFDAEEFFYNLTDAFQSFKESIADAIKKIRQFLENFYNIPIIGTLLQIILTLFDKLSPLISTISGQFKNLRIPSDTVLKPIELIDSTLKHILKLIQDIDVNAISNKFSGIFGWVSDLFTKVFGNKEDIKNAIAIFFDNIGDAIKRESENLDFSKLMKGVKFGALLYVALQIAGIAGTIENATKKITEIPKTFTAVLENVGGVFKSLQKTIEANRYIKIATAIAILSWAILQLSAIDENRFMTVAATLVIAFALLAEAAKSLGGFSKSVKKNADNITLGSNDLSNNLTGLKIDNISANFSKFAQMLIGLAALIAASAFALKQVSGLKKEDVTDGVIAITAIVGIAAIAAALLSKATEGAKWDASSVLFFAGVSLALYAAGTALAKLASLDPLAIAAAGGAISAVIFSTSMVKGDQILSLAKVLIVLSLGLMALTNSLAILGPIAQEYTSGIFIALSAIALLGLILLSFAGIGALMMNIPGMDEFPGFLMKTATSFIIFSAALLIAAPAIVLIVAALTAFTYVLMQLTADQFDTLKDRLVGFGLMLLPLAAVVLIISAAVDFLAKAVLNFALASVVGSLSILSIAASIALVSLAISLLVGTVIKVIDAIDEYGDRFIEGVRWILLTVIGLLVGYRVYIANSAVGIILTIISVLLTVGADKLIEMVRVLLYKVAAFLYESVKLIADIVFGFIVYLFVALNNTINENKEALLSAIERLVGTIISLVVEATMRLLADAIGMIAGFFVNIFGGNGAEIAKSIAGIGKSVGDTFASAVDDSFGANQKNLEKSGQAIGGTLETMAKKGAEVKADDFIGTITSITEKGASSANDTAKENSPIIGENLMAGLANGMIDGYPNVQSTIGDITSQINFDFANGLDIHSPSRITEKFGRFWDLGLAIGIRDNTSEIEDANTGIADKMKSAIVNAMNIVGRIANGDLSIQPLVKPVVDMSNVTSASRSMSNLFDPSSITDLGVINARVTEATASRVSSSEDAFSKMVSTNGQFTINVYSQPGMDEDDLANAVIYKIQNGIIRRGAALG